MMHLNTNGGQVILADEEYFYVFNKRGFYLCSANSEPTFVYFDAAPTANNKVTWWGAGWTENAIIIADVSHSCYFIPRHTQEFETIKYSNHKFGYMQSDNIPDKVPIIKAVSYTQDRRLSNKDELKKRWFSDCFRFRQLCGNERYKREDKWRGHEAKILDGKDISNRDKININGTVFCPLPGELANDICFATDGLTLYVLHQMGKVTIIDVG